MSPLLEKGYFGRVRDLPPLPQSLRSVFLPAETLLLFMQLPTAATGPAQRMGSVQHIPFIRHLNSRERWPRGSAGPHAQSSLAMAGAGASHRFSQHRLDRFCID